MSCVVRSYVAKPLQMAEWCRSDSLSLGVTTSSTRAALQEYGPERGPMEYNKRMFDRSRAEPAQDPADNRGRGYARPANGRPHDIPFAYIAGRHMGRRPHAEVSQY